MLVLEWKKNYKNSNCIAVQIYTGLKLLNQLYLDCLTQKVRLSQCLTLGMAFSTRAMWHQNAHECTCLILQWFIHYILAVKKYTKLKTVKNEDKSLSFAHLFFHATGEQYTKTAIKAMIRHINRSKPYSHKKFQGYGKVMFVSFHLGLHIIHNSLQCFLKTFNSTSRRHICMQKT